MATVEELRLAIKAEVSDAVGKLKQYDRQTRETSSATTKMQSTFAQMRDVMQGPIAAVNMIIGAFKKVTSEVDKFIMMAAESELATSNLNSVLKATGGIAGISAEQIAEMADEMARLTLFEDEQVTQAEAVLIATKKLSKEVFPEALNITADLATFMGKDMVEASKTMAKALGDPEQASGALRKANVLLTESQEKQIKDFMAVNDTASAQKVIIDALSASIGGAAKNAANTATGTYQNMKKAMGEVNEQIGLILANSGKDIFKRITGSAYEMVDSLKANASEIDEWIKTLDSFASAIGNIFADIDAGDLKKISSSLREVVEQVTRVFTVISKQSGNQLGDLVNTIANTFEWISNALGGYIDFYSGIFTGDWSKTWEGLQKIVLVFSKNVLEIIQSVINAGLKFAQGFIDIYNKVDEKIKILPDWKITLAPIDLAALDAVEKRLLELGIGVGGKKPKPLVFNPPPMPLAPSGMDGTGDGPADDLAGEKEAIQESYDLYEERTALYSSSTQQMYDELDQYRKDDLEKEKEAQAKKLEHAKAYFDFIASAAENVFTAYMDYEQNKSDVTISNLEKQREAMEKNGQDTVAIDEKIKGEKNRIAKKQFEAEKLNSLAKIVMSTAESVQKAYSELGPIAGSIAAGVVGAAGIAQGAMVMSQQYVPMAEGGRGTVTKPTLFLAGEAGPEDFAFGPKRKGGLSGGTTVVNNYYGSPWAIREAEAVAMGGLARAGRGY